MRRLATIVTWICVLSLAPAAASAQPSTVEPAPSTEEPSTEEPSTEEPSPGASLGTDLASQYFFRGIVQETEGAIFQPTLEVGVSMVETDAFSLGLIVAGAVAMLAGAGTELWQERRG